jgi:hypothetical protein
MPCVLLAIVLGMLAAVSWSFDVGPGHAPKAS